MTLGGVISYDPTLKKPSYKINMLKIASFYVLWGLLGAVTVTALVEKSPRPHRQGVGACSDCVGPPTNIPGGDPAGPPVLGFASPDRPPLGTSPPLPAAAAPPVGSPVRRVLFQKALAPGPAGAKNSEEWRAICLQIVRRYRNRPEGGMPATEYCTMAYTVESHPCPARRRRGKRALLWGLCGVVASGWALQARKSRFWRLGVENHHLHPLRAL